jgi:hypothetical protein
VIAWALASMAAASDGWWVSDPALQEPLRQALVEVWPERADSAVVRVGAPAGPGLSWDGAVLSGSDGERVRTAPAEEAAVAVLLARTWALPAGAEDRALGFLPSAPAQLPILEPPPEVEPRWRWRVGVSARTLVGQPRWLDGARVVAQLVPARGGFGVEAALGAAPEPSVALPERGGDVRDLWADRASVGVAGVAAPLRAGAVALRMVAGPELYWVEHWLYVDGRRRSATGWARVAGTAGLGVSIGLGRWTVVGTGIARASAGDGPTLDGGVELDLRYAP